MFQGLEKFHSNELGIHLETMHFNGEKLNKKISTESIYYLVQSIKIQNNNFLPFSEEIPRPSSSPHEIEPYQWKDIIHYNNFTASPVIDFKLNYI